MEASPTQTFYTCPMHPQIQQTSPGSCPLCGMALEPLYPVQKNPLEEYHEMRWRFWVAFALTLPVLLLSLKEDLLPSTLSNKIQLLLCTLTVFWMGAPLFTRAWKSLLHRSLNMFSLITLGISVAYFYSATATLFPELIPDAFKEKNQLFIYFETASVITTLVLLGQVLELKARNRASLAIATLLNQAAKTAHLIVQNEEKEVPVDQIHVDDLLRVKPGEKVPTDGVVVEGSSFVDESMITGEAVPVEKLANSPVTGGTLNQIGSFIMKATRVGKETLLAKIIQAVSDAQRSKAPIQKLADRVAGYFVPAVILVALLTFLLWIVMGSEPHFAFALLSAISVLIIACPCALGLATPISIIVGVGRGAEQGILIKNAQALEKLENIKILLVDKTGTLTEGKPKVQRVVTSPEWSDKNLMQIAASLEIHSEHPIAIAIVQEANRRNLPYLPAQDFTAITGHGIRGIVETKQVFIGTLRWMEEQGITGLFALQARATEAQAMAQMLFYIAIDGKAAGFISVTDPIKASTPQALKQLHQLGLQVIMVTGDHEQTANAVAAQLQINGVHANVQPENKQIFVERYKQKGEYVAMAGDGINDAPALSAADVGIAMGNGTDVAMEVADVTLVKGDLQGIAHAIALSRATMNNIRQNLFFAFFYNIVGILVATGIFYPFIHLLLNPMIAGGAMTLSSLSVILNALRLKGQGGKRYKGQEQ